MQRLWLWFLARFRLSMPAVCEMSKGRGLHDDYHDYHDYYDYYHHHDPNHDHPHDSRHYDSPCYDPAACRRVGWVRFGAGGLL